MDTPHLLVVRREKCNPAIENRDLYSVVGHDQFQVVILHWIACFSVTINTAEVEQVLLVDRLSHLGRNFGPAPDLHRQVIKFHAFVEHALTVLDFFQLLYHMFIKEKGPPGEAETVLYHISRLPCADT